MFLSTRIYCQCSIDLARFGLWPMIESFMLAISHCVCRGFGPWKSCNGKTQDHVFMTCVIHGKPMLGEVELIQRYVKQYLVTLMRNWMCKNDMDSLTTMNSSTRLTSFPTTMAQLKFWSLLKQDVSISQNHPINESIFCLFECLSICFIWYARQDSNLRPTDSKSGALSS